MVPTVTPSGGNQGSGPVYRFDTVPNPLTNLNYHFPVLNVHTCVPLQTILAPSASRRLNNRGYFPSRRQQLRQTMCYFWSNCRLISSLPAAVLFRWTAASRFVRSWTAFPCVSRHAVWLQCLIWLILCSALSSQRCRLISRPHDVCLEISAFPMTASTRELHSNKILFADTIRKVNLIQSSCICEKKKRGELLDGKTNLHE